jgi:hypothetical protein
MEKSEIKAIFRHLEINKHQLSQYQADFVRSLKRYYNHYNKLSARQAECLISISNNLVGSEVPSLNEKG